MKKFLLSFICVMTYVLIGCDSHAPIYPSGGSSGGGSSSKSYVLTGTAVDITYNSAVVTGELKIERADYDSVAYGVLYSTDKSELESQNGEYVFSPDDLSENKYSVALSNLESATKYYYRAFVYLNEKQYKFGNIEEFTTLTATSENEITILTGSAEDVTYNSVILYGELDLDLSDDTYTSVKYGISYSTNRNDLQSDIASFMYCSESLQDNRYSVALSDLKAETKYYYCAFVHVNDQDFKFGTVKDFTTLEAPEVVSIPVFSVNSSKQVTFSPGNLQYHPANNTWRFALSQTECIGAPNSNISSTYNGWIDLFGWSTSATNFGVSTSTDYSDYSGSFVDWGTNKIGNDAPNTWRTLTYDEWNYLLNNRNNASSLCGVAQVNGVNGLVFLPDNWTCPAGVTFKSGFHSSNGVDYYAAYQTFITDQWAKLEAAGAIFLPAAGYRYGSYVGEVRLCGLYWSATEYDGGIAYCLLFLSGEARMDFLNRNYGLSVRLVKDL